MSIPEYGKKVRYSDEGRRRLGAGKSQREATVVGENREGTSWAVVWDGTISRQTIHKNFVSFVQMECEDASDQSPECPQGPA